MKQQPMARKLLALALSLLLVLAFTPTVFAEGDVAKIGNDTYETLAEAFKNAQDGATIQLIDNTSATGIEVTDKSIILDIGNFTITAATPDSVNGMFKITESGKLTVNGNGGSIKNEDTTANYHAFRVASGGSLVIGSNVNVTAVQCCVFIRDPGSSLTTSGNLTSTANFAVSGNGSSGQGGTSVTVSGGSVSTTLEDCFAIYQPQSGTLEISGGSITGDNGIGIKSGTLKITGGTITANGAYVETVGTYGNGINSSGSAITVDSNSAYAGGVDIQISGGIITSANGPAVREVGPAETQLVAISVSNSAELQSAPEKGDIAITHDYAESQKSKVSITGGTFSQTINNRYLDENTLAVQVDDGKFSVGTAANTAIASAQSSVKVLNGKEITGVPAGVTVTNSTDDTITVNDQTIETGKETTIPEPEQPSKPSTPSFTEPTYYPDYDEDVDYLPPVEDEPEQTEPAADLYMVTCRTLNVRTGGSTAFSKLGTISRGTVISGSLENGWVKFTYNGQTAYCSADYLQKVDGDLSGLHVTCRTLNVRAGAGTNFQILGTLSRGTEIDVLESLNGWYKINFLGGVGYVSAAYIG